MCGVDGCSTLGPNHMLPAKKTQLPTIENLSNQFVDSKGEFHDTTHRERIRQYVMRYFIVSHRRVSDLISNSASNGAFAAAVTH